MQLFGWVICGGMVRGWCCMRACAHAPKMHPGPCCWHHCSPATSKQPEIPTRSPMLAELRRQEQRRQGGKEQQVTCEACSRLRSLLQQFCALSPAFVSLAPPAAAALVRTCLAASLHALAPSFCKSATPAPLAVTWQHQTLSFGGGGQAQGGCACKCGAWNPDWQGLSNRAAAVAGLLSARRVAAGLPRRWVLQRDWPVGAPGRCLIAALGPEDAPSTRPGGLRQVPARPGLGSWRRRWARPGLQCAAGPPINTTCPQTRRGGPGAVHKSSAWPA